MSLGFFFSSVLFESFQNTYVVPDVVLIVTNVKSKCFFFH